MPCNYYSPEEEHRMTEGELREVRQQAKDYKTKLDETTRLLCNIMHYADDNEIIGVLLQNVDGLSKWWAEHQKMDESRRNDRGGIDTRE